MAQLDQSGGCPCGLFPECVSDCVSRARHVADALSRRHTSSVPSTSKPSNPKDAIGSDKLPLHLWPVTASAMGCVALLNGMLKYGGCNFRRVGVRASIYVDAAKRHLDAWFEGEEVDPDDGVPHIAAALACLAIIVDARAAGKLTDDRPYPGGARALMTELARHVPRLKALHAGKNPKHYTIADKEAAAHDERAPA